MQARTFAIVLAVIAISVICAGSGSAASIAEANGARLVVSDSTESSPAGISRPVMFYAQFLNASNSAASDGSCNISVSRLNLSGLPMTFNGTGDNRFNLSVQSIFPGESQYNVTCWSPGLGPVIASDSAYSSPASNVTVPSQIASDALLSVQFNATFTNASNGALVSGGSCAMYFPLEAGHPLAPAMAFNASSGFYELRRSFSAGGNFSYNVSCSGAGFDQASAQGSVMIRQYLPNVTRFSDPTTTNFSAYASIDSVDVIIANQYGYIHWIDRMNATLRDFDSYVFLGSNFVSVDISGLGPEYNSSVEVFLRNAVAPSVVVAKGVFYTSSQVRAAGVPCDSYTAPRCYEMSHIGSAMSFKASYPASFALGADANLSVRTDSPVGQWERITVFANYSNSSNGAPIHSSAPYLGACKVTFSPLAGSPLNGVMSYDPRGLYMFTRDVNLSGTFDFNVTCESDTFTYQQAAGSFVVVAVGSSPAAQAASTAAQDAVPSSPAETPLGPVDASSAASPSRTLVATSGGLTAELGVGEEADVSVNGVTIIASVESVRDGVASARLGSERGSISQGQELLMDVDKDGKADVSMKLVGVSGDSVKVVIKKLRPSDEDYEADASSAAAGQASSSGKSKPMPIEEPYGDDDEGLSWWWFILIFVILLLAGKWYFKYNSRIKGKFV